MAKNTRLVPACITWRAALVKSDLPPTVKHVGLTLSLYMSELGDSAYPGITLLSGDTSLHERTVKRALVTLRDAGWLRVVYQGGSPKDGPRLATEYAAVIPMSDMTGGALSTDRGFSLPGPGAHGPPISSKNSPKNSRSSFQSVEKSVGGRFRGELRPIGSPPDCPVCLDTGWVEVDKGTVTECTHKDLTHVKAEG